MEISPLAGGMKQDQIGRLEFSDSEEEEEEAMIRTDARSPETCQSDMSASSTETVPTAREVTRNVAIIQEVNKGCMESCDGNGMEEKNCEKGLSTDECHSKKKEDDGKDKGDSVSEEMLVVSNSQEEKNSPLACTSAQTPVIEEDVKTQSKSETESSQLSADRAVFLQTLHDTNKILMEIKSSMDDPVVCVDPKAEADLRQEKKTANVKVNSEAGVDSVGKNQKSELNVSNSTVELLAAGVGVLDLSDSGCLEREMDSLDKSGTLADISSSVHSSAILKDCSRESLRDDSSFPAHQDYIPKCNTDSVLEEISSVENSLDLVHGVEVNKSPLLHINSNNSCHSSGHSTDHQPESSFDPVSSYNHSSSLLTDSVSFHERDSGCSPRKHKRRDRGKEASNQHSSSSASQSVVFPEGSYAGQGKHRDRSYLGMISLFRSSFFRSYIGIANKV